MKKFFYIVPVFIALAIAAVVAGLIWWNSSIQAPSVAPNSSRFLITRGASAQQIGNKLESEGFIKSSFAFKLFVQIRGLTTSIPPGEFRIESGQSLEEVIDTLLKGPVELWVTVPEGLRREQLPERFITGLELEGADADNFRQEFLTSSAGLEGYLFPETYLFPRDVTATKVVQVMRETFDEMFPPDEQAKLISLGLTLDQAVSLASIIERETRTAEERSIVAGIFLNRLADGIPLQADATVQYVLGTESDWWPSGITREDLEINSPFNTYQIQGIPASPIASPGKTSLLAVANPESSDFYYYIHDPEGQIHYGRTLSEHNANVRTYLGK